MPIGRACAWSNRRGRRGDPRQPGYQRLAQRAPLFPADAAGGGYGTRQDARDRRCQALGRRRQRGPGALPRSRAHAVGQKTRLWRTRGRRRGFAGARASTRCSSRSRARSIIGKGNVTIVDLFDITTGNATYGQDVKFPGMLLRHSPAARGSGQGRVLRRQRCDESAWRRQGGEDRRHAAPAGSVSRLAASR